MRTYTVVLFATVLLCGSVTANVFAQRPEHQARTQIYYCPMHPSYTSDKPGDCPICNMRLVKKEEPAAAEDGGRTAAAGQSAGVFISPEKQQLIGVKTDRAALRPLTKTVRTVGRVAFDPELYKAQQEYVEALNTRERVQRSAQEAVVRRAESLVEAAALKLKLMGLDGKQIEALRNEKSGDRSLLLSEGDSAYTWVYATIYEYEMEWVRPGQRAVVTAAALPGKEFTGEVVAIDPVVDALTRSVRARIKTGNPAGLLKPDMYVDVAISCDQGVHLAVPKDAILDSGVHQTVFLAQGAGRFRPVRVRTGLTTQEYVQILEGVREGEEIVVSGNFLIDSESKLQSALEGAGEDPQGQHRHE